MLRMTPLMAARFLLVAGTVAATTMPATAFAQRASPREMACHDEATKRYIEDFRRIGHTQGEPSKTAIVYVNDKARYETYYAECLGRWNFMKPR